MALLETWQTDGFIATPVWPDPSGLNQTNWAGLVVYSDYNMVQQTSFGMKPESKRSSSKSIPRRDYVQQPLENTQNRLSISYERCPNNPGYIENGQENPVKFAFVEKIGDVVYLQHWPVLCRDFLLDTLMWDAGELPHSPVYNYSFFGPIDKDRLKMVLFLTVPYQEFVVNLSMFNEMEDKLGISRTTTERGISTGGEDCAYITGDSWWMTATPHLSWYSVMLRMCSNHPRESLETLIDWARPNQEMGSIPDSNFFKKLPFALKQVKFTSKRYYHGNGSPKDHHSYNGINQVFHTRTWSPKEYNNKNKEIHDALQSLSGNSD